MRRGPILLAMSLAVAAAVMLVAATLAADPTLDPTTAPVLVLEGGDLRSEGSGPGLVGNPLLVLGAVVILGASTAIVTLVLARLARRT